MANKIVELSEQQIDRLNLLANEEGVPVEDILSRAIMAYAPPSREAQAVRNAPSIALVRSWLAQVPVTDEEKEDAEKDLIEFKQNMNEPRKEMGARLHFPEVEE